MAKRQNQEFHNQVCQFVAKERFPFPSAGHPNWKTYVNEPETQICFKDGKFCPDIVVLNENNSARLLGEIETDDTVNSESVNQWKDYSEIAPLYLYVPVGFGNQARELAGSIKISGFREYKVAEGEIRIFNV